MSSTDQKHASLVDTAELQAALEANLHLGGTSFPRISRLERTPSQYGSSYPLEELAILLPDGQRLDVMFKNVSPAALSLVARRAKPAFLDDPMREIEVYRSLLAARELGTPALHGSVTDEGQNRYWLFLEKVTGRELYQVGEFDIWKQVARWLAGLHREFSQIDGLPPRVASRLLHYDAGYYSCWPERAKANLLTPAAREQNESSHFLRRLAGCYSEIVRDLMALPVSLIHGEFYASNVIVQGVPPSVRVCAIDWERAAIGPGLIDLAALTAGNWSEQQKAALAREYFAAIESESWFTSIHDLLRGVDLCRLHLAVQWLGWSSDWSPPEQHRQNWLAEAVAVASRLGYYSC